MEEIPVQVSPACAKAFDTAAWVMSVACVGASHSKSASVQISSHDP
jgi:hypothetical protein